MTLRKATTRPRRASAAADGIPADLAKFFEFGGAAPWDALIPPHSELMREHWKVWATEHRDAAPPAGWEWIASPPPTMRHGQPYDDVVARAREWARKVLRPRRAPAD